MQLVAKIFINKEIGKDLRISTITVKTYLIHIYNKLGVDDHTSAVTMALEKGINPFQLEKSLYLRISHKHTPYQVSTFSGLIVVRHALSPAKMH